MMNKNYVTGEVIRARLIKAPFIFHYGLIVHENNKLYVLHRPFPHKGKKDTIEDFFKGRYFTKSYGKLTQKTDKKLLEKFEEIKDKDYSLLTNNCEDFMNSLIGYFKFQSGKLQLIFFSLLALTVTYKLIKNK